MKTNSVFGGAKFLKNKGLRIAFLAALTSVCLSENAVAQGFLERMADRAVDSAKRKVEQKVQDKVDRTVDRAVDAVLDPKAAKESKKAKKQAEEAAEQAEQAVATAASNGGNGPATIAEPRIPEMFVTIAEPRNLVRHLLPHLWQKVPSLPRRPSRPNMPRATSCQATRSSSTTRWRENSWANSQASGT